MKIIDRSESVKDFKELADGDIFRYNRDYYLKLGCRVEPERFNAVNLTCGNCCKFDARTLVEPMAGHTLELS